MPRETLAPVAADARAGAALRIGAQRDRLLAIPVAELARYRINVRALAILPVLAVEVSNAPLRERVIALSVAQAEQLSWSQLARLLPWIYADDAFRRCIPETRSTARDDGFGCCKFHDCFLRSVRCPRRRLRRHRCTEMRHRA